jgi:hypothetical protein
MTFATTITSRNKLKTSVVKTMSMNERTTGSTMKLEEITPPSPWLQCSGYPTSPRWALPHISSRHLDQRSPRGESKLSHFVDVKVSEILNGPLVTT